MNRPNRSRCSAIALSLSLALVAGIGTANARTCPVAASIFIPNEVVLKLRNSADLLAVTAQYGLSVVSQFGSRPIYQMRINSGTQPEPLSQALASDARVQYAEPNFINKAPEVSKSIVWAVGGDAGTFATQWAPQATRLPEAHALSRGAGVTVAVLDTGIETTHPVFAGRLRPGFDFVDFDDNPSEMGSRANPGFGHGTHVAGLVALSAPAATIMPIRVLDPNGAGNIWVLSEGLLHAVDPDRNPLTNDGAQVINLSLGTSSKTNLLADIVGIASCALGNDDVNGHDADIERCARFGGAVVVAAAGNTGDETRQYPAAEGVEGAISIGASTVLNTLASVSTRGDHVQLAAPGEQIIGPVPGSTYGVWTGTSMASPFVAGTAALMRSGQFQQIWPKPTDIVNQLISTGRTLCGTGLKQLDAAAALGGTSGPSITCP